MHEQGGIVRAVSDASGCVHDGSPKGIDVPKLLLHVHNGGSLTDYTAGERLMRDEIFDVKCDVFVPAALGGVITGAQQRVLAQDCCTCAGHDACKCCACTLPRCLHPFFSSDAALEAACCRHCRVGGKGRSVSFMLRHADVSRVLRR